MEESRSKGFVLKLDTKVLRGVPSKGPRKVIQRGNAMGDRSGLAPWPPWSFISLYYNKLDLSTSAFLFSEMALLVCPTSWVHCRC